MAELVRLQKFMADCGVASRRACEELIEQGRVKVDGKVIRTQGLK
jgi:23S rRNA pseudouridine2605 synthase